MKRISTKQAKRADTWAKVCVIRDGLLTAKFNFLMDEQTGKRMYGTIEHHHNDRDRSNNTLENCRTVSSRSHRHITDNNIREVPDRLGLKIEAKKPNDKPIGLAGWNRGPYSKQMQTGARK